MAILPNQPITPQVKPIEVTISLDRKANALVISKPEGVRLSLAEPQEVVWKCDSSIGDTVEISFFTSDRKPDTPFGTAYLRCSPGGRTFSGTPLAGKARTDPYKYTVRLIAKGKQATVGSSTGKVYVDVGK